MTWHGIPIPIDDRDDWLAKRKSGIGASDVAGILGLSPWATPFTVWADKTQALVDEPTEETEEMDWGRTLEDLVIDRWEEKTGLHAHARQWLVHHPDHPWVMATLDALAFESPDVSDPNEEFDIFDPLGVVEAKTDAGFGMWDEGPPDHVRIQCMWQMFTTGLPRTWVPVLFGGRRHEVYEIEYDEALAKTIFDRVDEWRQLHIVDGEPPEPDDSTITTRKIKDLWPLATIAAVELSDSIAADVEALRGWKEEAKRIDAEIRRLENKLRLELEDAEVGLYAGEPLVTYKTQHRDAYTVEAKDYRVLRLKPQKEST